MGINEACEIISPIYTPSCFAAPCGLWLKNIAVTISDQYSFTSRHFATMDGLILEGKDDGKSNKARLGDALNVFKCQ